MSLGLRHSSANKYSDESPIAFKDVKRLKVEKIGKSMMNLEKRCGIPNYAVYHFWNLLCIFDSFGKYILYNTNLFGHFTLRKGILSLYSTMYPMIAIFFLYIWAIVDQTDLVFKKMWVYKF